MTAPVALPSTSIPSRRRHRWSDHATMQSTTRSMIVASTMAVAAALLAGRAQAAPPSLLRAPVAIEKRKAVLSDSDVLKIADKVPSDLIILIGVTMLIALLCLLLAIVNVRFPSLRSKRIANERAQARTDLRVRGAGQHYVVDRKQSRRTAGITNSTVSQNTIDSKSHLIPPQRTSPPAMDMYRKPAVLASGGGAGSAVVGPRVTADRPSRASRGYSFYNKQDLLISGSHASKPIGSRLAAQRSLRSSQSSLLVPVLPRRHTDVSSDASSTVVESSLAGSSNTGALMGPRPLPSHARQQRPRHPSTGADRNGHPSHNRISSTTVGRGSIVNMNRNYDKSWRPELPMPPQLIDPAYGGYNQDRNISTPRSKLPGRYDLHRTMTDPRDSTPNSRRNSFAHNNGSPIRSPSYFDGSGSESHSYEGTPPTTSSLQQHPLLPSSQIPRTRPLALYDTEAEQYQGNHLTGLLDDDGSHTPRKTKPSWRIYS